MKKIFSVLLVVALAASTVFAGITGEAKLGFGANFDTLEYGFIDNAAKVGLDLTFFDEVGGKNTENPIAIEISGSVGAYFNTGKEKVDIGTDDGINEFYLKAKLDSAKIFADDWYVSLMGNIDNADLAKSFVEEKVEDRLNDWGYKTADEFYAYTFAPGYAKAPGVEVGLFGYTIGAGFWGKAASRNDLFDQIRGSVFVKTPEYALAEGLTAQAAASYAYEDWTDKADYVVAGSKTVERDKQKNTNSMGIGGKIAYASDVLSASVATDLGFNFAKLDTDDFFGMDVAANVKAYGAFLDAYYGTSASSKRLATDADNVPDAEYKVPNKDLVSVTVDDRLDLQAGYDFATIEVPLKATATIKNVLNDTRAFEGKVETTIDAITASAKGGFEANPTDGDKWYTGIEAEYAPGNFTVKGGVDVKAPTAGINDKADVELAINATVETTALIDGATIGLSWDADNLLAGRGDADNNHYGKALAYVKVAF